MRDLRLIPVVALAAAALFVLKVSAIVIEGGYTLVASRVAQAQGLGEGVTRERFRDAAAGSRSTIQRPLRAATASARGCATSTSPPEYDRLGRGEARSGPAAGRRPRKRRPHACEGRSPPAEAASAPPVTRSSRRFRPASAPCWKVCSSAARSSKRARARSRCATACSRPRKSAIEQRLQELKETEARITGVATKKDEAEAAKFKSLVSMYENMKAKDAAKVFDRLNMRVLIEVVNAMNPRRMSDILGQMTPEVAERLTIEIANRSGAVDKGAAAAGRTAQDRRPAEQVAEPSCR